MKYKKYTYLEVKEIIEKQGYTVLSKEYLNCYKQKLKLLCPKGHLYLTTFVNFLDGKNPGTSCSTCYGNAKIPKEVVLAHLVKHGYTLEPGSEYVNSQTSMLLKCSAGHSRSSDFCNLRNNPECPICRKIDREAKGIHPRSIIAKKLWENPAHVAKMKKVYATRKKSSFPHYTREVVKGYLEAEGYKLLSEAYRIVSDQIEVECPVGHKFWTTFGEFYYSGERCDKCYHIRRSIEQTGKHHSPERIAKILASLCARPNG